MRSSMLLGAAIALSLPAASAWAQDRLPLFVRGGLGSGFGTLDEVHESEQPATSGAGLQWDAAVGAFVTPWLAVHASAFGSVSPDARPSSSCVDNCGPNRRTTIWAQAYGAGLTLTTSQGLRRSSLRPFFSASAGLALVHGQVTDVGPGFGVQALFGLAYEVTHRLHVGLGVQGMFEGKRSLQLATEDGYKAGHAGGLLIVIFDRRPKALPVLTVD